ncbi:uridine kinase [Plantactinospora siamensis]|uniref:Uridine kinase n=1 Tax=Plantactinospora siamensis TaxID=555372 RepID=A0ABV6NXZ2_9ACTN
MRRGWSAVVVETYAELARRIRAAPARLGAVRLVAVDGPSGAGKTLFTARLADALQGPREQRADDVTVLHTDDLLDGWADQFTFWRRLDEQALEPLRAGRPGGYHRYSWLRERFTTPRVPVPAHGVLLIEGVSAARAAIRPELTLAVFVTAPDPLRLDRTLARDGERLRPHLLRWRAAEAGHFAADGTAEAADLLVDGAPTGLVDPGRHYQRLR